MFVFSTVALMMTGMGLFKSGFLSGRAPTWVYLVLIGLGGTVLALLGVLEWSEATAARGGHCPLRSGTWSPKRQGAPHNR